MAVMDQAPEFVRFFEDIEDPRRHSANLHHDLIDIVAVAVVGVICGADSWTEIVIAGKAKEDWLRTFLTLRNGIPSHDTFGRVFSVINPEEFRDAFARLVATIAKLEGREVVAIDGKTVRRSHDRSNGESAIHMVSAWATKNRVVLGQVKTDEKSNEITAIPELLKALALKDVIVTIDAMGCQKGIAEQIVGSGGNYVLAVKGNQPTLHDDANHLFDACLLEEFEHGSWSSFEKEESSHGRIEKRTCYVTHELEDLSTAAEWTGIRSLIVIVSERTVDGKTSIDRRLYVSSLKYKARKFSEIVRAHWGIENSLHWVLDMAFREDECRVRAGYAAENLVMLRHLTLNMIKQTPWEQHKVGVKAKRLAAALDTDFLRKVLEHADS